jgi:hypothetical protein
MTMPSVSMLLLVAGLLTLVSGVTGKAPLWIQVLLIVIVLLVGLR